MKRHPSGSRGEGIGDLGALVDAYKNYAKYIMEDDIERVRRKVSASASPSLGVKKQEGGEAATKRRVCIELPSPPVTRLGPAQTEQSQNPDTSDPTSKATDSQDQLNNSRPASAAIDRSHAKPQKAVLLHGRSQTPLHLARQQVPSESQLIAEGIKSQIASDAEDTMRHLLAIFLEAARDGDEEESHASSSTAAANYTRVSIQSVKNESLRSAAAQAEAVASAGHSEASAVVEGGFRQRRERFTASRYDIMLETLTKRTSDQFGVGVCESAKLPSEAQRQLGSLASKGFSIHSLGPRAAHSFPFAMIFDPVIDQADGDSLSGTDVMRYKCRIKCMLVGRLHRKLQDDSIIGHPDLSRSRMHTTSTLSAVAAFEQQSRQSRRRKMRMELDESPNGDEEQEIDRLVDATCLPQQLKSLLVDKAKRDRQPIRAHKQLPAVQSTTIVTYDQCTVEPHLLIVYEEDDFLRGRPKELGNALVPSKSSAAWREGKYSDIEYTMRWSVPIADVDGVSMKDEWVRRRFSFPVDARRGTVPLRTLMSVCRRGAVSVDLTDNNDPPHLEYRHSFTFSKLKLTASSW